MSEIDQPIDGVASSIVHQSSGHDSIDLVIELHEFSPEARKALRRAVEERRRQHRDPKLVQEFGLLLERRRAKKGPEAKSSSR